jgi:spore germination cell wall hydrolase CwlJ-like protein
MLLTIKHKITIMTMMFLSIMAIPSPTQFAVDLPTINLKKIDMKQIACMARNIYYEAGAETMPGQAAVARVVMNRINHGFAETPCKVIYQKTTINENIVCQFSWVCEDKTDPSKSNPRYKRALQVAYEVMVFDMHKNVVPKSALFFHAVTIDPLWPYKQVARIGNHIFYSKQKVNNEQKPNKK